MTTGVCIKATEAQASEDEPNYVVLLLVVSAIASALSIWFAPVAGLASISAETGVRVEHFGWLTSTVLLGFIFGATMSSRFSLLHRQDKRTIFAGFSIASGLINLAFVATDPAGLWAPILRFSTGVALAGVYPVGLAIAADFAGRQKALFSGALVGGLTAATAVPHAFNLAGGVDWRSIIVSTSTLAVLAALLIIVVPSREGRATELQLRRRISPWENPRVRLAIIGYCGHMWELYAFWAWIPFALTAAGTKDSVQVEPNHFAVAVTIAAILAGAVSSVVAGSLADKYGKALVAKRAVQLSAAAGLACGWSLHDWPTAAAALAVAWGASIIADSGQYSAIVSEETSAHERSRVLAIMTAIGYTIAAVGLHVASFVASKLGWSAGLMILCVGPLASAVAMKRLAVLEKVRQ